MILKELKKQIDEVNLAICSSPTVIDSPLHKVKGLNSIEIAYIMSAIININRFDSVQRGGKKRRKGGNRHEQGEQRRGNGKKDRSKGGEAPKQ